MDSRPIRFNDKLLLIIFEIVGGSQSPLSGNQPHQYVKNK